MKNIELSRGFRPLSFCKEYQETLGTELIQNKAFEQIQVRLTFLSRIPKMIKSPHLFLCKFVLNNGFESSLLSLVEQ